MNYFSKIRLGTWIVIILTVINLATLGTIFYKHLQEKAHDRMVPSREQQSKGFKYFVQELKLSPEQEKLFCESRKAFFDLSGPVFKAQEELRIKMIKELSSADPDTAVLYKISEEMSRNYLLIKQQTILHLLKYRAICTPEQRKKLDTIYHKIIRPEGPMRKSKHIRKNVEKMVPEEPRPPHQ
jgi:Spy/CpxP family protein refolding chaperone